MKQIGAIAAGHEVTARIGAETLADGGNAVDAAVAAAFASCTCEPTLTGLGGAGFATIHIADTGQDIALDFFAAVPGIDRVVDSASGPIPVEVMFGAQPQTFNVGPQSCAVPGFVAGLLEAHERWGRLPRQKILRPAAQLARAGLTLTPQQAYCHYILSSIVLRRPEGRAIFSSDGGGLLEAGEHFAQPSVGDTIDALAEEGPRVFYQGDIADEIVRWADECGGLLSRRDLLEYRPRVRTAVRCRYHSFDFVSAPPPSSGGALISFALRALDLACPGPLDLDSAEGGRMLAQAMEAANRIRGAQFDSLLYGDGLVEWLLDDERVEEALAPLRPEPDTASSRLGSTTHLSVLDSEGNAVSLTTSTGCGSGEFAGSTGIHLNNMLGEDDLVPVEHRLVPGDRLTSMMAPSLLLLRGRPLLATGSAGSSRLRSAILQTLLRVVQSGRMSDARGRTVQERLEHAVSTARLHVEGGLVHAEPDYSEEALQAIEASGGTVNRWPEQNVYFGGVNMVGRNDDGSFAAAGDPRRGGGAALVLEDGSVEQI